MIFSPLKQCCFRRTKGNPVFPGTLLCLVFKSFDYFSALIAKSIALAFVVVVTVTSE